MATHFGKHLKQIFSACLAILIGISACNPRLLYAAAEQAPTVTMDKTVYQIGETPQVHWTNISGSGPWYGVYAANDTPGAPGIASRFWSYIPAGDGQTDFSSTEGGSWHDLNVGNYKICMFGHEDKVNDAYVVLAQFDFSIKATPPTQAPLAVTYERKEGVKRGFAEGKITITPPQSTEYMSGYAAYWGDDTAPHKGYAPIKIDGITDSGKQTRTYSILPNTFIPAGTTRLYVYAASCTGIPHNPNDLALSPEAASTAIPADSALLPETPLYSFQVTSDWHMFGGSTDNIKARRLDAMLKDVKATDPDSIAIIANGDVTDNSGDDPYSSSNPVAKAQAEFDVVNAVLESNKQDLPPILFSVGNHDLRGGDGYAAQLSRFLTRTGTTDTDGKPYYYKEIGGAKFIILGSEHTGDNGYNYAELSAAQLTWFENTLREHATATEPIFVCLHQPLRNTTSGTTNGFRWYGVNQDSKVRAILKKYPQAIWFSGHTHWELESKDPMYTGYGNDFSAFNGAGTGLLYDDTDRNKEGSQGLFVEVYKDKTIIRGRDFENKLWVTYYQFMLDNTLPVTEQVKKWTADKDAMLEHKADIQKAYAELSAAGNDAFAEALQMLRDAKTELEAMRESPVVKPTPVKNGWILQNGTYYYYQNNVKVVNRLIQADGKTYGTDKNGARLVNCIYTIGGKTYAFDKNGIRYTGTRRIKAGGKYYCIVSGKVQKNKVIKIGKKRYALNKKGQVQSGNKIVTVKKKRYFVNKKGIVAVKTWKRVNKKWIYASKTGALYQKTTKKIGGKKYKFNKKGFCTNK